MDTIAEENFRTASTPEGKGEVLVRVENVSKKFCRSLKKSLWYGLQDAVTELTGRKSDHKLRKDEFWAVKDVSFELRRGECLGLIGRNGAGKTTLLRMLNGLIKPDQGRISNKGQVGALIALGAGFNPILTGRENIYVSASVLGLTQLEIKNKIEEIIEFSEIEDFIDAPVQSYSSGMQVRLGFSIATALSPDVLLLDEVLAVGDASFRAKCYRRISELRSKAAVIFVSHNMEYIARICDRALVLSKGEMHLLGTRGQGVEAYENLNQSKDQDSSFISLTPPVESFRLSPASDTLKSGENFILQMEFCSAKHVDDCFVRIALYNAAGAFAAACDYQSKDYGITINEGLNHWELELKAVPLRRGNYTFGINIISPKGDLLVWSHKQHQLNVESDVSNSLTDCQLPLNRWEAIQISPLAAKSKGNQC